jgi:predicted ArsR family transcriptional regulator
MKGWTVPEMAQILGIKEKAVKQRLYYAKLKALTTHAVYSENAFETIKAMSKVGRPKKEEAGDGDLPEQETGR